MNNSATKPQLEVPGDFNRNAIAVRYGLMTGFICMFLTTVNSLYILPSNFVLFRVFGILLIEFAAPIFFYSVTIRKQRNLNGGFISIKDAFRNTFIISVILVIINTMYGLAYVTWFDPAYTDHFNTAYQSFALGRGVAPSEVDKQLASFEADAKESTKAGVLIFSIAKEIILKSIFGFLTAMVLKRDRPVAQTL